MYDEFKIIKFRNNGIIYTARAIKITEKSVNASFMSWIGAFRIYDEDNINIVGKICFQQSSLLDYIWANPNKKKFPNENYNEEALVNLLSYLPFNEGVLALNMDAFIFRFIRDYDTGYHGNERIYNIKVDDSMEKAYKEIIYGDKITENKINKSILEPLYMHRLIDFSSGLPIDNILSILPFEANKIYSSIELLEYKKCIVCNIENRTIKISPKGISFLENMKKKKKSTIKNIRYGHNINIKTGDYSPININADIDFSFDSVRKEIEDKNLPNKTELINDLNELQTEIKNPKDLQKMTGLLNKLKNGADWVGKRVEPIIQQIIASYISGQINQPPTI